MRYVPTTVPGERGWAGSTRPLWTPILLGHPLPVKNHLRGLCRLDDPSLPGDPSLGLGPPDHEVAAWLGHANISTTSTYLKTNRLTFQKAAKRFERQWRLCKAAVNTVAQAAKQAASAGSKNRANVLN